MFWKNDLNITAGNWSGRTPIRGSRANGTCGEPFLGFPGRTTCGWKLVWDPEPGSAGRDFDRTADGELSTFIGEQKIPEPVEKRATRLCEELQTMMTVGMAESSHHAVWLLLPKSVARKLDYDARVPMERALRWAREMRNRSDQHAPTLCRTDDQQQCGDASGTAWTAGRHRAETHVQLRGRTLRGRNPGNNKAGDGGTGNDPRICRRGRCGDGKRKVDRQRSEGERRWGDHDDGLGRADGELWPVESSPHHQCKATSDAERTRSLPGCGGENHWSTGYDRSNTLVGEGWTTETNSTAGIWRTWSGNHLDECVPTHVKTG